MFAGTSIHLAMALAPAAGDLTNDDIARTLMAIGFAYAVVKRLRGIGSMTVRR